MSYQTITQCRCCLSTNLKLCLDLGEQPLANAYHDGTRSLKSYPLAVNVCQDCWHMQLTVVVDPKVMYTEYAYASGDNAALREYSKQFAEEYGKALKRWGVYPSKKKTVLDIACNDGTQLDAFKELGWDTYGVDPAENLVALANHKVVADFWGDSAVKFLGERHGATTFDLITAQNVFAHTHDVEGFLRTCKKVMHDTSVLIIQTSQANMIKKNQFDTIYHEHLSFFNTNSMTTLVDRCGLKLQRVNYTPIHGMSYAFVITRKELKLPYDVGNAWESEYASGLYGPDLYDAFRQNATQIIVQLGFITENLRKRGYKLIGYGAAAKGMTVLNASKVSLDYIVDDSPLKQGKLTPGMNIPIVSRDVLAAESSDTRIAFVPLAWNFFEEISANIKSVRNNPDDVFVKYFPTVTIK